MKQKRNEFECFERLNQIFKDVYPNLNPNENVLRQIDSLSLVDFILRIESEFGVEIRPNEINDRNFASFRAISEWIERL